jgi:hypothetical protein
MRSGRAGSPELPSRGNDQRPRARQMTISFSARAGWLLMGRVELVLAGFVFGT